MAVRLQLKLGAVTEQDRLPDSPDTVVVVEPSVGSVGRTKGNLYLLVTSTQSGAKAREATRLIAETIRNEYYYDESAGIRQCLAKILVVANKRLAHQREKLGLGHQGNGAGPIGVAVAVVRGRELYVATVGPAEAYLIRQARLSTLPDPNAERGLPCPELEPEVWRGELSVGDSLCLISRNVMTRIGTDVLKDALVTLHPQSAIEHIHARFSAADGRGSDGAFAFEATEVGATFKQRTLVPVRPAEPLAGAPEKGPLPLADSAAAGAAAVTAGAGRARNAAGNAAQRLIWGLQDRMPHRSPTSRRVTTATSRMEMQRRAAVALLAFIAVASVLVFGVYALGGQKQPTDVIASLTVAEQAYADATTAYEQVLGPGVDLVVNDPKRALELLNTAYAKLAEAQTAGYPLNKVEALRAKVLSSMDQLYGVVWVANSPVFTFPAEKAVQLTGLVRGSDNAPYVLDVANKTVWRIDLAKRAATPVLTSGDKAIGGRVADPRLILSGGPDVLVLDSKNQLWRWRPVDSKGNGTLVKINVVGASSWSPEINVISTFVSNYGAALYKLYVVDPTAENIQVYSPSNDGSGYPQKPSGRLPTNRPVGGITSLLLDGDIFVAENGGVTRVSPATGWSPVLPKDTALRPSPRYTLLASPDKPSGESSRRAGVLYAFDAANHRIVGWSKDDGSFVAQYLLAGKDTAWSDLQAMYVLPGADDASPATVWWISSTGLHTTLLEPVADPNATPAPTASPSPSPTPKASPAKTPKPRKTPKPSPTP